MDEYLAIVRFFHIISGILWIGLLYYFNFVQVPSFPSMEAAARSNVVMNLVPRALAWFRYTALTTFLFGLLYFVSKGIDIGWGDYLSLPAAKSILVGGTIGTIMFLNVWAIIWPNQKKVIAATTETVTNQTPAPPDQPRWARRALLASRTNTLLSIPMLFFMIASVHLGGLWG